MSMPEATVNEDHGARSSKDEVWFAREFPVQPVAKTHPVKCAPQGNLGKGILCPDPGHHATSGFSINNINHER